MMTSTGKPIGFIGLGMMGLPMARCMLAKGFSLMACDTAAEARAALAEGVPAGAVNFAPDPAAVGAACDIIVTMLANSTVMAEVMSGPNGLLGTLRSGALVIDMGSSIPAETQRLAALAAARDAVLMDAPVSGGVVKARAGTLAIMAGGGDADFARAEPVLRAMGEAIISTGPIGSAHAMKALNNFVFAAGLLAASEALRMGEALGLDLSILADVLNASSGRNVATETKVKQEILNGRYSVGFQLGLMRKDLDIAGTIAAETGFDAKSLALCRTMWADAVAALGPRVDNTEIHRFLGRKP